MKLNRFVIALTAVLAGLALGSCVHQFPEDDEPEPNPRPELEVVVSFANSDWQDLATVNWHVNSRATRAQVHTFRYSLNIYDRDRKNNTISRTVVASKLLFTDEPSIIPDIVQHIPVSLPAGEYSAIVWVDYSDAEDPLTDLYYDTNDFTYISILGDKDHPGNNHHREGFRGVTDFTIAEDGTVRDPQSRAELNVIPVLAERPMARFEFVTTDLEEFITRHGIKGDAPETAPGLPSPPAPDLDDYNIRLRYTSYMPSTYNANTDKPIDSKLAVYFYGKIERISDTEASLGFDHVFVNHNDASVMVALDVIDKGSGELIASCDPVTVPLKRNHHTVVRGRFLTATSGGSMGVDPDFEGEFNIHL